MPLSRSCAASDERIEEMRGDGNVVSSAVGDLHHAYPRI